MPYFNTIPAHERTVEVPRSFIITLTDEEARAFTRDLQKIAEQSEVTKAVIRFMGNRNN